MTERIDTVVVGGGQAGLAISWYLTRQGRQHVVLEQGRVGESWRSQRWDSFTLVTPNWMLRLPGFPYQGNDPDGFLLRDEVVAYLEQYVALFRPPLRLGVRVTAVEQKPGSDGYLVKAESAEFETRNVVVATGLLQQPKIPSFSAGFPAEIVQIHSGQYRNPSALPAGGVLVVGSGQSGCQIAEEINQSGRKVYLCVGSVGKVPRRYRGKDIIWWTNQRGGFDRTVDTLPSPKAKFVAHSHLSGKGLRGHTLNLHQFARDGVVLLGHLLGIEGSKIILAPDLRESLAKVDEHEANLKKAIDQYVLETGMDMPEDSPPTDPELRDGYQAEVILELDLGQAGISTIIWAIGYRFDYSWVRLPVFDEDGYPVQKRGVTAYPGLYFLGMAWLHTGKSGLIFGVGEDAAHIAADIATRT